MDWDRLHEDSFKALEYLRVELLDDPLLGTSGIVKLHPQIAVFEQSHALDRCCAMANIAYLQRKNDWRIVRRKQRSLSPL